jgi:hypothetical protein
MFLLAFSDALKRIKVLTLEVRKGIQVEIHSFESRLTATIFCF